MSNQTFFVCTECGQEIMVEKQEKGNRPVYHVYPLVYFLVTRILCGCGCKSVHIQRMRNLHQYKSKNTVSLLYKDRVVKGVVNVA